MHLMNANPVPLTREHLLPPLRQLELPRSNLPPLRRALTHSAANSRDDLVAEADTEELEGGVVGMDFRDEGDKVVDPGEVVVGVGGCKSKGGERAFWSLRFGQERRGKGGREMKNAPDPVMRIASACLTLPSDGKCCPTAL